MRAARHRLMTCLLSLTLGCTAAGLGMAQNAAGVPAPVGLMWNRSGLPAVFPLQVRTDPGQDYLLTLVNAQTKEKALAAYIKGGAFFRVLVPPGRYHLRFATGTTWQGEAQLFGPGEQTNRFDIGRPLRFEIRGHGIKAGHLVDLRGTDQARAETDLAVRIKAQRICQTLGLTAGPTGRTPATAAPVIAAPVTAGAVTAGAVTQGPLRDAAALANSGKGTLPYGQFDLESWPYGTGFERYPRDPFAVQGAGGKRRLRLPAFALPEYDVRSHYC